MIKVNHALIKRKLLYQFQSSFRRKHSTDTWFIHLTDFIKFQMDKGYFVRMVLLDLSESIWHSWPYDSILLMKLEALGLNQDITERFRKRGKILGKHHILSLFPNSFDKFNKTWAIM